MNHEIRTPLNAMLGFSELLETEVETERGMRFLKSIQTSGESLAELVNDILDLSKIESGALELDPEPVRVGEFVTSIEAMFSSLAEEKGLEFLCRKSESCPEILVFDALRLRQIIVNMIGNAIKFTETGFIRMEFAAENVGENKSDVVIRVKDSGRGIEADKLDQIFQPFKQANRSDEMRGGTGLGLSICRELAELMNGTVYAESEIGSGSTFIVELPDVEIGESAEVTFSVKDGRHDFNELPASKILVVDDNPYNRDLIGGFLEETHHQVFFATNGVEGLRAMRKEIPDVVLMDIRMPVMSGDEAREKMKQDEVLADIPVIAVTASSLLRQEKRLRKQFDGYLRKPFSGSRLYDGIREALGRTPVRDRSQDSEQTSPRKEDPRERFNATEIVGRKELIGELQTLYRERWESLTSAMVFSDVFAVAELLFELGEKHHSSLVLQYSQELRRCADNFDQAGLEKLLTRFHNVIEEIEGGEID